MRETTVMGSVVGASPRQLARIAGALYLINISGGAFAIGIVPALLFGPDPATSAQNIQAHELLYRSGLVAHLVSRHCPAAWQPLGDRTRVHEPTTSRRSELLRRWRRPGPIRPTGGCPVR
jgi:hypothetical protein